MCLLHNHGVLTSSYPCGNRHLHDFRLLREEDKNCTLLGYYAASSGNFLQTFWDNLLVPSSKFKVLDPCVPRRTHFSKQMVIPGYKRGQP